MGEAPASVIARPIVRAWLGTDDPPLAIRFWDGSTIGAPESGATIVVRSPNVVRRLVFAPNELGLARAYVAGELDVEGDVYTALSVRDVMAGRQEGLHLGLDRKGWLEVVRAARQLGAVGRPLPPPPEEAAVRGRRHSRARDAAAVSHHYDVGNDFYRLVLGPTMTYSCAFFATEDASLDEAQRAKYDLVARKLALAPGMRLLDVGCGWGGMVIHAAKEYGVKAVGITVSEQQAELAEKRVAEAGVSADVDIRLQDYRDVDDEPFDAISSIGMFEHVGVARLGAYFGHLYDLLAPRGRLLNHAISRPPGEARLDKHSFIERYVFPDGELLEVGSVVTAMQEHGFEVRDVHSLREHYALTLRQWGRNLEEHWDEAVGLVGEARARIWRLYMAGCVLNFEQNRTSIHQVLGAKPDPSGRSAMPLTRAAYA